MRTENTYYTTKQKFIHFLQDKNIVDSERLLIQLFISSTDKAEIQTVLSDILTLLPHAKLIGATTDGEICSGHVSTGRCVVSVTHFENTRLKLASQKKQTNSYDVGLGLSKQLEDSKVIITFFDGLLGNGDAFLEGASHVNNEVVVAGGMAADVGAFQQTYIFCQDEILENGAVGVGLVSDTLQVHTDFSCDWFPVGQSMRITKAEGNRVYTIDDQPAIEIYKQYLGEEVLLRLPEVSVEFPLLIHSDDGLLARAAIQHHSDGSISFAGGFDSGSIVSFGYGDADVILKRSSERKHLLSSYPIESIFIYSCMARRRFMPNLIEEETLPFQTLGETAGFFTYGEFFSQGSQHHFMNHTMTVLGLSESNIVRENNLLPESSRPVLNAYQESVRMLSHLLNTTTKKLADKNRELEKKSEIMHAKKASLRMAQEVGHFGSWEINLLTFESIWSEESFRIYKLDPRTTKPTLDTFMSRVIEEDKSKAAAVMEKLKDGSIQSVDLRVERTDGVIITVLLNGKMLFNEQGQPVRMIGTTLDITEQVKLRARNEELVGIIEASSYEIYIVSAVDFSYLYVNNEALRQLGYTTTEIKNLDILDVNQSLSREEANFLAEKLIQKKSITNRTIHTRKDGTTYPVQSYLQLSYYHGQRAAVIIDIDITELVKVEANEKRQAQILDQIHDSVVTTNLNDIVTHWNSGARIIHGYTQEEMLGQHIETLYLEEDLNKARWIKQQALVKDVHHDEIRKVTKDGMTIYTDLTVSTLKNDQGEVIGITRYSQNVTEKKEAQLALEKQTALLNFQAYHDVLTQLPNREFFNEHLEQAISYAKRHDTSFALLFIDLDNFKQINDTLGHHFGDVVLKSIAARLGCCIRKEDTLSRWGGDEFTIIVQDLHAIEVVARVAQKIIDSLRPKIVIANHELHISASIGISLYPKDAQSKDDLLKFADSAMYKAKDEGRKNYQFYSSEMTRLAFEKVTMESHFYSALESQEFVVYYQPQIDGRDGSIVGMEALVRWQHPKKGLVSPAKFIPLAEETGFIKELDSFVMLKAMQDVSDWYAMGLNPGVLALNLSIKQLMSVGFVEKVKACINMTGFDVKWLEFEVTESDMMRDPKKSIAILQRLSEMGIEIAIDDFGTGYSSLAYLKRLPVNKLKIDQSFIQDITSNDDDRAISKAVIALAKSLNLSIIAEGVESQEQLEFLISNGCYYIQGFFYSQAIAKEKMTTYIKEQALKL